MRLPQAAGITVNTVCRHVQQVFGRDGRVTTGRASEAAVPRAEASLPLRPKFVMADHDAGGAPKSSCVAPRIGCAVTVP